MAGLPKHVPFLKSQVSLRVGQTVQFRIVGRSGDVQAVDISLECDAPTHKARELPKLTADASDFKGSLKIAETPSLDSEDVMKSMQAQSHSRCFLRRMSQFRNLGQGEQVQLVIEAEKSLDQLLRQTTLDGDAICRLARKCASWLHPPVLRTENPQRLSDHASARGVEDQVHLQGRVRKIVIDALNHLDLQDPFTFQAMKAALFYLASLCQCLDEKCGFSSATLATKPARKQWLELKSLLAESGLKSLVSNESYQLPCPGVEDQCKLGLLPSAKETQGVMKEMDGALRNHQGKRRGKIAECYEPTPRLKACSTVSQGTAVKLMCSECPFTMTSCWYFQHPKTLKRSVIAPRYGHDSCREKVKTCHWKNLDGGKVVRSIVSSLEYCPHQRLLDHCASCDGARMCKHAKRRNLCKECRHLYVGRLGPKKKWSKMVQKDCGRGLKGWFSGEGVLKCFKHLLQTSRIY